MRKISLGLGLIAVVLTSCNTGNKLASSFGKRKYTKGYFANVPAGFNRVTTSVHATAKTKPVTVPYAITIAEPSHNTPAIKPTIESTNTTVATKIIIPLSSPRMVISADTALHKNPEKLKETNFVAVVGCAVSIIGIILTAIAYQITLLSGIVLGVGVIICMYSLFLDNKIYLTWVAVIGLSLTILLLALLLL